jgi:hypothetical protein
LRQQQPSGSAPERSFEVQSLTDCAKDFISRQMIKFQARNRRVPL